MRVLKNLFKKENLICFFILAIITFILCWKFTTGSATFDHYKMNYMGYVEYAKKLFFNDGRIFSGFYILIANLLNIDIQHLHIASNVLGVFIVCFTCLYYANILKKLFENANFFILTIISYITILNFMCVDIMTYIEFPIIFISIFFYIISAENLVINGKNTKSILFLLLAIFCYQGTINVFFSLVIFFLLLSSKKSFKTFFIIFGKSVFFALLAISINFIYMEIYSSIMALYTRTSIDIDSILLRIPSIVSSVFRVLTCSAFALPKYTYLALILYVFLLSLFFFNVDKNIIFNSIFIFIYNIIVCLPLVLIFRMSDLPACGRLFWAIGSSFGMISSILYFYILKYNLKYHKLLLIFLIFIYFSVQFYGMHNYISRIKNGNIIDKSISMQIKSKITEFEKENNLTINNIIIKVELTHNGLTKYYQNLNPVRSYILSLAPVEILFSYYTDIDPNIINYNFNISIDNDDSDSNILYQLENDSLLVHIKI